MKVSIINKKRTATFTLLVSLLFSCGEKGRVNIKKEENYCLSEKFKSEVETVHPIPQLMVNEIQLSGIVEPNFENVIDFKNLTDGVIVNTHFLLGDYVMKGQIMAEVRSTELTEWKAKQKILASQLKIAQHEHESIQAMYDDGIASQKELYKSQYEIVQIESELEEINSNLTFYNASPKNNVFLIKAPGSGFVTEKNIRTGTQVRAYEESLFTISELADVWVQVNIYSSDLNRVAEGMEVEIRSLSYPDSVFTGKIDAISYVLDEETRVIKARVNVENKNLLLKPGMFVDVTVTDTTETEVLGVPTASFIFDENKNFVIIYKNECDLTIKEVEYINQINGIRYVDLDQLSPKDKVVSKSQLYIYEQLKNFKN